ncbi:hypothetical protein [Mycolicibacterium sarraceniae]|uniref:Uncharacterized protein n=1 Tax=Mycolicibacterium sarraceniae TaxID=1534348 RepID=A0A7I7SNA6_9MYCO|nr:hypothetical protein [Mycolicibacterium sarraceniae]BBY57709.1 hypothetical protein MSAR_08450 [Mycolicibacterium sarraceniae]
MTVVSHRRNPDTFYQPEGLMIMTSTYQGLRQYAPGFTKIAPLVATTWDVTPAGLTYTFALRDGGRPARQRQRSRVCVAGPDTEVLQESAWSRRWSWSTRTPRCSPRTTHELH